MVKSWYYQSRQKKCASDSTNKFQNFIEWLNRLKYERRKLYEMETALCFHDIIKIFLEKMYETAKNSAIFEKNAISIPNIEFGFS